MKCIQISSLWCAWVKKRVIIALFHLMENCSISEWRYYTLSSVAKRSSTRLISSEETAQGYGDMALGKIWTFSPYFSSAAARWRPVGTFCSREPYSSTDPCSSLAQGKQLLFKKVIYDLDQRGKEWQIKKSPSNSDVLTMVKREGDWMRMHALS